MSDPRRTAIVTGARQGIGAGIALDLAAAGVFVFCADIADASDTVEQITAIGGECIAARLDVTNPMSWNTVVASAIERFGRIDILGNVAGVLARGTDTAVGLSLDDWDFVTSVNLKGVWLGMRAVLPTMVAQGSGNIVSISSLAAYKGQPNLLAYSTTKGAVVSMTQQAAVEYASDGIRINAIAPGVVDTPILGTMSTEMKHTYSDAHLIKRLGTPADVASLFTFLVSPAASFITGHTYRLDGGASIS